MLKGLHFLLTYKCLYECDHCFLYCGPHMEGTFTIEQIEKAIVQGIEAGIGSICVEGGEPFLYYPILLEGVRMAAIKGFQVGIVTNDYWATFCRQTLRKFAAPTNRTRIPSPARCSKADRRNWCDVIKCLMPKATPTPATCVMKLA